MLFPRGAPAWFDSGHMIPSIVWRLFGRISCIFYVKGTPSVCGSHLFGVCLSAFALWIWTFFPRAPTVTCSVLLVAEEEEEEEEEEENTSSKRSFSLCPPCTWRPFCLGSRRSHSDIWTLLYEPLFSHFLFGVCRLVCSGYTTIPVLRPVEFSAVFHMDVWTSDPWQLVVRCLGRLWTAGIPVVW